MHLELVTLLVRDYDAAIDFYVGVLGFELVEDSPLANEHGEPRRWVVVRPANSATGILLARADDESQVAAIGNQVGGRVGFFLGVEFISVPREEVYGKVVAFVDGVGNRSDLLGSPPK